MNTQQKPILKAHLEGVEELDKILFHSTKCELEAWGNECTCDLPKIKSFLTTYGINILKAAKKAGPKKMTMKAALITGSDAGAGHTIGHNSCIDDFHSAIDEGIEEIKKGEKQ